MTPRSQHGIDLTLRWSLAITLNYHIIMTSGVLCPLPNGNCWPISLFAREMLMEILDLGWWTTLRSRRANQFKTWAWKLQWISRWHQWTMKSRLFEDQILPTFLKQSRQDWRLKICKFQSDQIHVSMAPNYAALILVWCFQVSLSQCRDCPNLWSAWVQAQSRLSPGSPYSVLISWSQSRYQIQATGGASKYKVEQFLKQILNLVKLWKLLNGDWRPQCAGCCVSSLIIHELCCTIQSLTRQRNFLNCIKWTEQQDQQKTSLSYDRVDF